MQKIELPKLLQEVQRFSKEQHSYQELIKHLESKTSKNSTNLLSDFIKNGLNTNEDRASFITEFRIQYTEYYTKIMAKYPQLSANDLRLIALIKLGLASNEIAEVLRISEAGVKKSRQRLREKLNIEEDKNLKESILNLDN